MPFGLFMRSVGHGLSLAPMATSPTAQAGVACFLAPEAGISAPEVWTDIYRLAYEQARAALEPSRLQAMLQPCMN